MLVGISIGTNIILIGILVMYRRQISAICRQLAFIRKNETNMLVTSEVSFGEIKKLVNEINQANKEGKEIVGKYKEKDALLRQTITSLSHDIRTPLTSLDGYLQLLETEQEEEKQELYLGVIKGRVTLLKEILEELFLYTKLKDQDYQLELQKENMTQIVFEGVIAFYEEFKNSKREPKIVLPEEPLDVNCHKGMMERVVQNIVKNSILHGASFVELSLEKEEGQAVLRCKNDMKEGSTINMDLIFERFYKADISRSKSSSGLGLAITKELVEKMNGTIEANRSGNIFEILVRFDLW